VHTQVPGLFVRGKVVRRTRRIVGAPDAEKTVVNYGINIGDEVLDVEEWEPSAFLDVGEDVSLDVRVRTFVSKAGRACSQLERYNGARGAF
jgi:hypothetical protein